MACSFGNIWKDDGFANCDYCDLYVMIQIHYCEPYDFIAKAQIKLHEERGTVWSLIHTHTHTHTHTYAW